MRKLRNVLAITMFILMTLVLLPIANIDWQASAATGGTFGGCEWSVDSSGILTIKPATEPEEGYASGTLPSFATPSNVKAAEWPWYGDNGEIAKTITKVVIDEGVKPGNSTSRMFCQMEKCTEINGLANAKFDTSAVTNMSSMFINCKSLENIDISTFDISNVTNVSSMFQSCSALKFIKWPQTIESSNIENMSNIFAQTTLNAETRKGYIKKLLENNGGTCTNWTYSLFNGCTNTNIDVSDLDTANCTDMSGMFNGCTALKSIDGLGKLNTANVKVMSYMFINCEALTSLDLSNFDTSNVTYMSSMFRGCKALTILDLSNFDTSNVTDMSSMFRGCKALTILDLSKFDTSNVMYTNKMFNGCSNITTILVGSGWSTTEVEYSNDMFKDCSSLRGGAETNGTTYDENNVDKTYARVDGGTSSETPGYLTSPDQYLKDKTIVLKNGKAYADSTDGVNITAAVADKGLKYVAGTEGNPAHWEMDNFNFDTTAATAVEFADNGTEGTPTDITIKVVGTNSNITSGESSSESTYGMFFTGEHANVTISGSGAESSRLSVTSGNATGDYYSNGLVSGATSLTFKGLTAAFTGESSNGSTGLQAKGVVVENDAKVTCTAKGNGSTKMAVSSISEPDAKAVDTSSQNKLTWDPEYETYKNGDNIATDVTLTAKRYEIDLRDGNGVVYKATASDIDAAVNEAIKAETSYDKEFAGWSTSIDNINGGALITTATNLEKGTEYYAVWKNTDTGKIVVTKPLNFDSGSDSNDFASGTNLASATGISWNSSSNTLTLNGAIIDVHGNEKAESSANTQAVILLPDGATLVAADNTENTINLNSTTTDEYAFAIEGKGTLAISGNGTLNVNAKKVSDESTVKVYGISTSGTLSINNLTLNVFGQYKAIYKGESNTDNIEICGGTINAKCNTTDGDVIVEDKGKYAIHAEAGDIVISNGTVNAKGGAIGIIASNGKVVVSDGTVTVDSGTQGLYATTSVDITGGTVKATAHGYIEEQTGKGAKAIYSQGTIGISGTANVSATCINDNSVTADEAKFYGIRAKDNITISGNNVVVTANGTTAAFNLESGKTVTATNLVVKTGDDEASASAKTGDVTTAVTGAKYAKISSKGTPAATDFTFTAPTNLTADGEAKAATVATKTNITGMGNITVKYFDKDGTLLSAAPTAAGTYTVKIDVAEGTEYASATDLTDNSWTFTITEAAPSPTPVTSYTITFDANGAEGSMDAVKLEAGKEYTLPECGFTAPEGKQFAGWKIGDEIYQPGDKVKLTASSKLSAVWEDIPVEATDPYVVAKTVASGKTALAVSWTECEGASAYEVYANKCNANGKKYSVKKIATTSKTSYTIKKLSGKKLKKNTFYKVKVVALDASGNKLATSKVMHVATGGYKGKYGNTTKITAKKSETAVSVGDTTTVGVKTYKIYKNKKAPTTHAAKVRYMSSNKNVATVNSKGVVKGIKSGTCTIYMQAPNGLWTTTEVTVLQDTGGIPRG